MVFWLKNFFLTCVAVLFLPEAAVGQNVALILGNSDYDQVASLRNPARDAETAALTLRNRGFETDVLINANSQDMRSALVAFRALSQDADVAIIYFAGHGVQFDNRNFLLGTDATAGSPEDILRSAISLDDIAEAIHPTAKTRLLLIDACRDNPFPASTRSLIPASRGLSRGNLKADDMLVFYSAQPNEVALDGAGTNSPFMEAVAQVLATSETVKLNDAIVDITRQVKTTTNGRQTPYVEGSLTIHVELTATIMSNSAADICSPPHQGFDLTGAGDSEYVDLDRSTGAILVDGQVAVCTNAAGSVRVEGGYSVDLRCDDILDRENEGMEFRFRGSLGEDVHLWFYADPDAEDKILEVGIYRDDRELFWIGTGWKICPRR